MRYCLDTNILIAIIRFDPLLETKVREGERHQFFITPITACELFKGAFLSKRRDALKEVYSILQQFTILSFHQEACEIFGKNYEHLKRTGKLTQDFDLLIGSLAIAHDCILVTRNKKDFVNIPELKIEEW